MAKQLFLLLGAAFFLCLAGCRVPEWVNVVDHDRSLFQETIDEFFQAVDERDAEKVTAMFAPNVRNEGLDLAVAELLNLYPGPTEDCAMKQPAGSSRHIGWERQASVHNWFPVVSGGVNYYCFMDFSYRDDADPGNIGLLKVVFVTEKVKCNPDFSGKDLGSGLTVVADAPGDYLTCRIGDDAYIYTPTDQVITGEQIAAFLEENNRIEDFLTHFGQPNAVYDIGFGISPDYFYELPKEDGERRFARINTTGKDGAATVYAAYLYDTAAHSPIGTIWTETRAE